MDLSNSKLIDIIPNFMKDDEAVKSLAASMDKVAMDLSGKVKLLSVWDAIDDMGSEQLNALAEELYIPWYDKTAALDVRRQIIKESDMIHATLGTKAAVERVANIYFGESNVVEWFEYGGNHHCFRIETVNQRVKDDLAESFLTVLEHVKRKSAHLDTISIVADGEMNLVVGIVTAEYEVCESTLII